MKREDIEKLSKDELMGIIQNQQDEILNMQDQILNMHAQILELVAKLAELESRLNMNSTKGVIIILW